MPRRMLPLLSILALALGSAAPAQRAREPGLADLALGWVRGEFRAPLICEIDGAPVRGLRRLLIKPGPRQEVQPSNRILLFDLDVPEGTRCTSDAGTSQPNAIGSLTIGYDARYRPDTARHDFSSLLRRKGEVVFPIRAGSLRLGDPGPASREVVFRQGEARVRLVKQGSDAARRLADFGPRRKLLLELRAPDGTRLELDLVQFGQR